LAKVGLRQKPSSGFHPVTWERVKLDHRHFFIGILCHKILFLELEQGKQPRSFDMGNAWWTINNLNCGIDENVKIACCNNFTQIVEILVRGLLVNITKFPFGANLSIGQNIRIFDCQTPINPIKNQVLEN
jgi:hypothetical protein